MVLFPGKGYNEIKVGDSFGSALTVTETHLVLSAGLFTSQKAKETIYSGLQDTRSSVDIKGDVLAETSSDNTVAKIHFTVASVSAGEGVDFTDTTFGNNKVVISYSDMYRQVPSVNWTMTRVSGVNTDNILDSNELFQLSIDVPGASGNATEALGPYKTFTLEVKPPRGPVLVIERTIPARAYPMLNLH